MGELLRIEKWAENLEEVTMGRWLKAEGEAVEAGDALCEIVTEKVTFEYECPVSGVLLKIYAPEKSVLPVGYVFAYVGEPSEKPPVEIEEENQRLLEAHAAKVRLTVDLGEARKAAGDQRQAAAPRRVRAAPAARRLARQHGLSLADVAEWLGEDRPLTVEDVERYLEQQASE
ncbi:MAG: E3 binding domain-containing protein [Armatimonadetes bacterium]|nr:E3 binding domain-containing protein [Armatimonadota bacterium]